MSIKREDDLVLYRYRDPKANGIDLENFDIENNLMKSFIRINIASDEKIKPIIQT